jgi:glycosyltransferase involved in cell wall biosynthesis
VRIAVAAQTPPPYGGQAAMVELLLEVPPEGIELVHVPLQFSQSVADMGRFRLGKVLQLFRSIALIYGAALRRCDVLYYCVSGAERIPLWRDAIILGLTRRLFRRTVYHFHAGGCGEYLEAAPTGERWLVRHLIGRPDLGLKLSESSPPDPEYLGARRVAVVPNGLGKPRHAATAPGTLRDSAEFRLMFLGKVAESKGAGRLIDLVRDLRNRGIPAVASIIGEVDTPAYSDELRRRTDAAGLQDAVTFHGRLLGEDKWREYDRADVFVFLTQFPHENVPLVLIEAMMCRVPIVASRWRGIPGLLGDGSYGRIVDPSRWSDAVTYVADLYADPAERERLASTAYDRWSSALTEDQFRAGVEAAIRKI